MKHLEVVSATTGLDSQGERLSREALESIVRSVSNFYLPVGIEHDPRIPPVGRVSSGFVRERADGEFEAVTIIDIFENVDELLIEDKKEIALPLHRVHGLTVSYDWTYRPQEDQSDIKAIAVVLKNEPVYEVKKSADPISIISFTGAFVLGGIASGFLGQIGADGWNLIKGKLLGIFSRRDNRKGEQLLIFRVLIETDGKRVEIETILTNPAKEDIDTFLTHGLQVLDRVVPFYLHSSPDIRRLVFEMKQGAVELMFAVRKDCRAFKPSVKVEDVLKEHD